MAERALKVFLVAGEPSGDLLAGKLMQGLKALQPDRDIQFYGVGGEKMQVEGLQSIFPMEELTVMGIAEVLPQLRNILKRIKQTADAAIEIQPDIFISIDAPDFSFRVAKKLNAAKFKKMHYVAPSVWAWRKGRAAKIAKLYDHLLTLLPFEPPYFEEVGLPATFVGHSIIESGASDGNAERFRKKHNFEADTSLIMVLPGSRMGEVSKHMDVFGEALADVATQVSNVRVAVPVVKKTKSLVIEQSATWPGDVIVIEDDQDKYDAMAASKVALAASGTVSLELALAKLPSVIAYRMHPVTAFLAKRLIKLDYVSLINIIEEKEVVPEFLLENCTKENLATALKGLLEDEDKRSDQIEGFQSGIQALGVGEEAPGIRAARQVLAVVEG